MSKFIIQGGKKLAGEIEVKGAKNAALKIIPGAILSKEKISISNLPKIEDIDKAISLLEDLGAEIRQVKDRLEISTANMSKIELNPEFANKFRASIMFVGPILARFGEVKFPHPGGCVIGAGGRPIDLFLEGFKCLGAEIEVSGNYYWLKAKKLKPKTKIEIFLNIALLPLFSITATRNIPLGLSIHCLGFIIIMRIVRDEN